MKISAIPEPITRKIHSSKLRLALRPTVVDLGLNKICQALDLGVQLAHVKPHVWIRMRGLKQNYINTAIGI